MNHLDTPAETVAKLCKGPVVPNTVKGSLVLRPSHHLGFDHLQYT